MVWLNLKFNFKIVIISIQKSFLLLILIPFLSGLFHSYSISISNSFPFSLSIAVKKSFPFPFLFLFPLMEISLVETIPKINDVLRRLEHKSIITARQLQYLSATKKDKERHFYMLPKVHKPKT